jgi:hypothetical protein
MISPSIFTQRNQLRLWQFNQFQIAMAELAQEENRLVPGLMEKLSPDLRNIVDAYRIVPTLFKQGYAVLEPRPGEDYLGVMFPDAATIQSAFLCLCEEWKGMITVSFTEKHDGTINVYIKPVQ